MEIVLVLWHTDRMVQVFAAAAAVHQTRSDKLAVHWRGRDLKHIWLTSNVFVFVVLLSLVCDVTAAQAELKQRQSTV